MDLLKKIYEEVLVNETKVKELRMVVDEKVKAVVQPYTVALTEEEQEELTHLLFSTSYVAEKAGFEVGVWFMFQLLTSDKMS